MSLRTRSPERIRAPLLAITGLATAVLLSGATSDDAQHLAAQRRKVEGMTQSELSQLKRNYENFKKLAPEQRAAMIRLHDDIEQDTANSGQLARLLENYNNWFTKLSPFDRDAILSITDPAERAIRVQKLHDEQLKQRRAREQAEAFPAVARPAHSNGGVPLLRPATLEAIATAIEKDFLTDETKQDLPKLAPGRERHLRILRLAKGQIESQRQIGSGDGSSEAALLETIRKAITDEDVLARLNEQARLKEQSNPDVLLARSLRQSLLAEWNSELTSAPVKDDEIDTFVAGWRELLGPQQRKNFDRRLQSPNSRKFLKTEVALARNPDLSELRQVVNWLVASPLRPRRGRLISSALGRKAKSSTTSAPQPTDHSSSQQAAPPKPAPTVKPAPTIKSGI
jgi:hypothetical protein